MCKQCETRSGCPRRTLNVFNQTTEAISFGIPNSHRRIKNLFRDLSHAVQQRTTARSTRHRSRVVVPNQRL
jgi:hypothetical protein